MCVKFVRYVSASFQRERECPATAVASPTIQSRTQQEQEKQEEVEARKLHGELEGRAKLMGHHIKINLIKIAKLFK
ncbi:hypothetical protein ACLKA7_004416 [Drosophila subpalustris]